MTCLSLSNKSERRYRMVAGNKQTKRTSNTLNDQTVLTTVTTYLGISRKASISNILSVHKFTFEKELP